MQALPIIKNHTMKSFLLSKVSLSIMVLGCTIIYSGCYYDKAELLYPNSNATVDCGQISATFTTDVNPVIQTKCATGGCHDADGAAGGFILTNYSQINSAKGNINTAVVVNKSMPPSGPLNVDEISKIKCWISSGAPNN